MRVLFNTYPWAFDRPGGGEMQLMKYAQHLPRLGVEVVLHDLWRPRLDRVDLAHFFSGIGGSYHFCNYVRQRGLPLVVSSSLWVTEATRSEYPLGEIRNQFALAQAIVTNSLAEADLLAKMLDLPRERFMPVPNGVDTAFGQPVPIDAFRSRFNVEGRFVLNVANIEPRKNQLGLMRALKNSGLALVLIGHSRDPAYLEQVMAEGRGFARYLGPIDHDDPALRAAYGACSVFALPSRLETPGLAALEAAAAGAPIVITDEGSAREYFGDEVIYVSPDDIAGIRRAIDLAMNAAGPADLATRIVARYAWEQVVIELQRVYERAIMASASAGRR